MSADRVAEVLAGMAYARRLGVNGTIDESGLVIQMPYTEDILGNPRLPALHGGAVGAFMEIAAQMTLRLERPSGRLAATIGITVEYLRPCRTKTTYARATIKRLGRRIANVHVEAWQDDPGTPLALLQGRFLLPD